MTNLPSEDSGELPQLKEAARVSFWVVFGFIALTLAAGVGLYLWRTFR